MKTIFFGCRVLLEGNQNHCVIGSGLSGVDDGVFYGVQWWPRRPHFNEWCR